MPYYKSSVKTDLKYTYMCLLVPAKSGSYAAMLAPNIPARIHATQYWPGSGDQYSKTIHAVKCVRYAEI